MRRMPGIPVRTCARAAVLLTIAALATSAHAADAQFPTRPIRIVTPYAPGGTTDILSRLIAQHLTQSMGQQVIVDNRPGGGAQIGSDIVAKAAPDGYTLLVTPSGSHTSNPSLYKKLPYDTVKDFAPITLIAWVTNLIVTHPSSPIHSLQDLISLAKKQPGKLTYASSGNGTVAHLSAELLKSIAGINLVHVPYKGGGPALAAIAGNETTVMFAALPSATGFIQGKRIKALAVTSPKRAAALPDVPTVAEAGVPGIAVMEWYGMLAPARTPQTIVSRLNAETVKVIQKPEVRARFSDLGADPVGSSPQQFDKQIRDDIAMWAKVVEFSGARPE